MIGPFDRLRSFGKLRTIGPFDRLRANGFAGGLERKFPFGLSLSKPLP